MHQGVTWSAILWALQTGHAANWHPVTWLSHMLDVQLFGLHAGPHHLVNLLFHTANTLLLFLLFQGMTGALWRSAFVAALFALHPLHVESVAWISERKDVLSTFFGLLSLCAYAAYARKSKVKSQKSVVSGPWSVVRGPSSILHLPPSCLYVFSLLLFALSLMSKPMLVTLPCLLLLLDYWPLNRFTLSRQPSTLIPQTSTLRTLLPLFREKIPFLVLAAASSVVTFLVQKEGGAVWSVDYLPIVSRINNALVAYCAYLGKMFWPERLAVFYPYNRGWPEGTLALAALLLGAVSAAALLWRRRCPPLPVGWFWFLGTLVPVIGLVQVGGQAMADRYTYLPAVGVFMLAAWLPPDLLRSWRHHPFVLRTAGVAAVLLCLVLTPIQVGYWKNGETLFRHTIAVTTDNYVAHHQLGVALADQGKSADARVEFTAALKIKPNYSPALSDLAKLLYGEGQFARAVALLRQVLESHPDDALAHSNLAVALAHQGKTEEAIPHYQKAIQLKPDSPEGLNNLAWLLATHPSAEFRNGPEAVTLAERACQLTRGANLPMLSTLAAAYAEAARFPDAVNTQQKACALAAAQGQGSLADRFQRRLELYRSGQPYHEP